MTEMFGEAWSPMSVPDLAPDDDDDYSMVIILKAEMKRPSNTKTSAQKKNAIVTSVLRVLVYVSCSMEL